MPTSSRLDSPIVVLNSHIVHVFCNFDVTMRWTVIKFCIGYNFIKLSTDDVAILILCLCVIDPFRIWSGVVVLFTIWYRKIKHINYHIIYIYEVAFITFGLLTFELFWDGSKCFNLHVVHAVHYIVYNLILSVNTMILTIDFVWVIWILIFRFKEFLGWCYTMVIIMKHFSMDLWSGMSLQESLSDELTIK